VQSVTIVIGVLCVVGFLFCLNKLLSFLSVFSGFISTTNLKPYGSGSRKTWAVVTGASDGIGKSFAFQLAKRGFNIVLISRTQSKLDQISADIEKTLGVSTKVIALDFSTASDSSYEKLSKDLTGLDIGVLVNNVGYNLDYPQYFLEATQQQQVDIIEVNVKATTRMTYSILPFLVNRKKGLVINISSISSILPAPLLAVYSATKSYITSFSKCLNSEYSSKGVDVICLTPAFVVSAMSKRSRSSLTIPSSDNYARSALNSVGKSWSHAGYWVHDLMIWVVDFLPEKMVMNYNRSMHQGIKVAALKKRERLAKQN